MISSFLSQLGAGMVIRRSLFFALLILLTLGNLFVLFKGLNSPQAMDQAQISREIARGKGFSTKMVRPVAYYQTEEKAGATVPLANLPDTYHAPLNPLLNAAVLKVGSMIAGSPEGTDPLSWTMGKNEMVYPPDRLIAGVCVLCFLLSIGVNYFLICRIFDPKIGGVCAILMLLCEGFWNYSLSGLPQMLMLLLFSCAMFFAYRAVEAHSEGRVAMGPAAIAGVFLTLLALTHWMTVWIALGFILFAAVAFRPRGLAGITILLMILIPGIFVMLRNYSVTGSPFGTAFLTLYNGLGNGTESSVMRNYDLESEPLLLDGLIAKVLRTTLLQASDLVRLLGGIVVAPLFFIALLHPFKREPIARFRWALALMWLTTAFGLAFFGISTEELDPNQIHLLFAPLMTAYAVALVSVLWNRLDFANLNPFAANAHLTVIVLVCSLPFLLSLPQKVRLGMYFVDRGGTPQWPPYYAPALNGPGTSEIAKGVKGLTKEGQVVVSDQPWAVAWYADRTSLWIPKTVKSFERFEELAGDLGTPIGGFLISPSSHGSGPLTKVSDEYKDFAPLVIDGKVIQATFPPGLSPFRASTKLGEIAKRYPSLDLLMGGDLVFYGLPRGEEENPTTN
jgi:hypothetical protein